MDESDLSFDLTDEEEQLQARVAWYYYFGDLTQQQIATRMRTSRVRINRLLSASRHSGIVQIRINSKLSECVSLEQEIERRYGLAKAIVVPVLADDIDVSNAVGAGAGAFLNTQFADGQTVAIGWGRTMAHTLRAINGANYRKMNLVSMQGGLSYCPSINTFQIVSEFANRLGASCHYFAAPIYASSGAIRDAFLEQETIHETCLRARKADLALAALGDMTQSLVVSYGIGRKQDIEGLRRAGAVGDVLGQFVDAYGQLVDHELNRRVVAVGLDDLRAIPNVVVAAGGKHKFKIIRAVLRGRYANMLVTDEMNARRLAYDEED
ncbi:MAG: sugar-binding transcriptional regulator [Acidihalobacter sp.]